MSIYLYARPADLEIALMVKQGEVKGGTDDKVQFLKDSGTSSSVGTGYLEQTGKTWTVDDYVGAYLTDSAAKVYRVTSNTAVRQVVAVCLSDNTTATPTAGAYSVSQLGFWLAAAQAKVKLELSRSYAFPLAGSDQDTISLLREWTVAIAAYDFYADVYKNSSPSGPSNVPEIIQRRYNQAMEQIRMVAKGEMILPGETPTGSATLAVPGFWKVGDRLFQGVSGADDDMDADQDVTKDT